MSHISFTKLAIANAMKKIMNSIPFDDISINDIVKESNVSRKTFYYHFKDKYDVINWIFYSEVADSILSLTSLEQWRGGSLQLCNYIQKNKFFYTNAINATGQNCFLESLHELTRLQIKLLCSEACKNKRIKKSDQDFLIEFYYSAFLGVFTFWIKNDMKETPEEIVQKWSCVVDKGIERFIENFTD